MFSSRQGPNRGHVTFCASSILSRSMHGKTANKGRAGQGETRASLPVESGCTTTWTAQTNAQLNRKKDEGCPIPIVRINAMACKTTFCRGLRLANVPRTDPFCGIGLRIETPGFIHCWGLVAGFRRRLSPPGSLFFNLSCGHLMMTTSTIENRSVGKGINGICLIDPAHMDDNGLPYIARAFPYSIHQAEILLGKPYGTLRRLRRAGDRPQYMRISALVQSQVTVGKKTCFRNGSPQAARLRVMRWLSSIHKEQPIRTASTRQRSGPSRLSILLKRKKHRPNDRCSAFINRVSPHAWLSEHVANLLFGENLC